jgi:co-chaperonin GroES (HSP10)
MVWKPKEKELTAEEAIALAKRDLAPFWLGSEPLLAAVRGPDQRVNVYPLHPDFEKRSWLIFTLDVASFASESAMSHASEWHRRYSSLDLGFLAFFKSGYRFMSSAQALEPVVKRHALAFPAVVDGGGMLQEAFGQPQGALPQLTLLSGKKRVFEFTAQDWKKSGEHALQKFLRSLDPGLPLPPIYRPEDEREITDLSRVDFGLRALTSRVVVQFNGQWTKEEDRVVTSDPAATVTFRSPGSRVSVLAHSAANTETESTRISIELAEGDPIFDEAAGEDLVREEDGTTGLRFTRPEVRHALANLPAKNRELRLRFPAADRLPVAIYSLLFGEPSAK